MKGSGKIKICFSEKITLIDLNKPLVHAWQEAFEEYNEVEVFQGDYFAIDADLMVWAAGVKAPDFITDMKIFAQ